jgi:hypothetical protein
MTTMGPADVSCACDPFNKFPRSEFDPAEPDAPQIHTRGSRHWKATGIRLDAGSRGRDHAGWDVPEPPGGWNRGNDDQNRLL